MGAKFIFRYFSITIALIALNACSKGDDSIVFLEGPQTVVGKILMAETSDVDKFFKDTTYYLTDYLQVSEIAYVSTQSRPVRLFVFEAELGKNLWIEASRPSNVVGFGRQSLTLQAAARDSSDSLVLGGVNGDFFRMDNGRPSGIYVSQGSVLKENYGGSSQTFFAIDSNGKALVAGNKDFEKLKSSLKEVVGGSVWLLKDGKNISESSIADPRTAAGVSDDGTRVYLVVVDGRNPSYSMGMEYANLANFLRGLGAENAINMDGGGSSTFIVRNRSRYAFPPFLIRNLPSNSDGVERPVANGLLIMTNEQTWMNPFEL